MSGPGADGAQDLVVLREPTLPTLREDQLTIHCHLVHTAGPFQEMGLDVELLFDEGRQTGSPGKVVSLAAVFDLDAHGMLLLG
jgi:hypothetical protein